jgi:hypothetical protein
MLKVGVYMTCCINMHFFPELLDARQCFWKCPGDRSLNVWHQAVVTRFEKRRDMDAFWK